MEYIKWFDQLSKNDLLIAGGKGANLGEMSKLKLPVPEGFVITTKAFDDFVNLNQISDKIKELIEKCNVDNTQELLEVSNKLKELILSKEIPIKIKSEVVEAYKELSYSRKIVNEKLLALISAGRELSIVAVRSSATSEDLLTASFAGQFSSFLNVKGIDDLFNAVKKCWASLFEPRAIFYRVKHGIKHTSMAVIVQRMINSEASGVMFTVNPSTGEDEIVIETCFGLGETLVQGEIEPDSYRVSKDGRILSIKVGRKKKRRIRDFATDKTIEVTVPKDKVEAQVLEEDQILQLAEYGKILEKHYGIPQDVEFAIEKNRIYIVQTRAVTTKAKAEKLEVSAEPILKGLAASPGIATGKVKIIRSLEDITKVQEGDILVTIMTSPDLVPIMSKCSAIITDSGGSTCFAGDVNVLTEEGLQPMKKIYNKFLEDKKIRVLSLDSKTLKCEWRRIINVTKRKDNLIRISVSQTGRAKNNTLDLTPDHRVYTLDGFAIIPELVKKILDENKMICSVFRIPRFGYTFEDNEMAYLAGAMFSDGYVKLTSRRGITVFTQKNAPEKWEFISHVRNEFQDMFNLELKDTGTDITFGNIRGREIKGEANRFKSFKKFPAQRLLDFKDKLQRWCLSTDEENLAMFLAGLIDGDGSTVSNRFHVFSGKKFLFGPIILSCLRLGILPQVYRNRDSCLNFQITGENANKISKYLRRIKGTIKRKKFDYRFFAARQLLSKIIDKVNYKGKIKPYVQKNLLIGSKILEKIVLPLCDNTSKQLLEKIINSDLTMLRVKKIADVGNSDVYNLTVDAKEEEDHNYIVFTKQFTPIVVKNCHAAIVSREMSIPCVVGTQTATSTLKDNQVVTVDAYHGLVYLGEVKVGKEEALAREFEKLETKTKVYMNLGVPEKIDEYKILPFDGIGLMRIEFIIASYIGEHPNYLLEKGEEKKYVDKLAEGIAKVASSIYPKPVVVRFSDFKTNEYRELKGGEKFEPVEANPMLGWRGVSRYISKEFEQAFRLECRAIKKVRDEMKLTNVWVMLPFVRTTWEVEKCLKIMEEEGLKRRKDFKVWLMAEVPSIIFLADEFSKLCDGFSIGSNDLTQLILGADRDSAVLAKMGYFDERNEAVKRAMKSLIEIAHRNKVTVSICGQSVSVYPEITEFLIKCGIDSVSVNPDTVTSTRKLVYEIENK